jgi:hypothetical protein
MSWMWDYMEENLTVSLCEYTSFTFKKKLALEIQMEM